MKYPIPDSALAQHIAVLGKTGSGKTSTAKLIIEHVVAGGARVCILDPVKSDWWGLTSSADGKRPGLPFHILGGPHGHVPLHHGAGAAIAELVATAALPLSIIDMADFGPGGQAKFFAQFAPMLLKKMKGVLYLVMEEAHEFAPKERSGIGEENIAVHYSKKIATAGRSKGIRLIACSQRVQALHNAILGSCDTVIVHRMTAPADQEPVSKWLKGNVKDKGIRQQIEESLPGLKTGHGWLCSGEAKLLEVVQFPRIATFDNSATPSGDTEEINVRTAAVDRDKLRALIGDAVTEAEANDPVELKKRIRELEKQVAAKRPAEATISDDDLVLAEKRGFERGKASIELAAFHNTKRAASFVRAAVNNLGRLVDELDIETHVAEQHVKDLAPPAPTRSSQPTVPRPSPGRTPVPAGAKRQTNGAGDGPDLGAAARKILAVLSQFPEGCTAGKLTLLTRYRYSGGFKNALSELRTHGLMEGENTGVMRITDAGLACGPFPELPRGPDLAEYWLAHPSFGKCAREVLRVLIDKPSGMTADQLTKATNYEYSGGFKNALAELRTAGVLLGKNTETMRASEDLF